MKSSKRQLGGSVIHRNKRFIVRETHMDGSRHRFTYVEKGDGVGVIAVHNQALLLVKQFRPLLGRAVLEIPGGGVGPDETARTAARRELREETGHDAFSLKQFWVGHTAHTLSTERLHIFESSDVRPKKATSVDKLEVGLHCAPVALCDLDALLDKASAWAPLDLLLIRTWWSLRRGGPRSA